MTVDISLHRRTEFLINSGKKTEKFTIFGCSVEKLQENIKGDNVKCFFIFLLCDSAQTLNETLMKFQVFVCHQSTFKTFINKDNNTV